MTEDDRLPNRVRADNVGSLLRAPYLLDARHAHLRGTNCVRSRTEP